MLDKSSTEQYGRSPVPYGPCLVTVSCSAPATTCMCALICCQDYLLGSRAKEGVKAKAPGLSRCFVPDVHQASRIPPPVIPLSLSLFGPPPSSYFGIYPPLSRACVVHSLNYLSSAEKTHKHRDRDYRRNGRTFCPRARRCRPPRQTSAPSIPREIRTSLRR